MQAEVADIKDVFEFLFLYPGAEIGPKEVENAVLKALNKVELAEEVLQIHRVLHTTAPSSTRSSLRRIRMIPMWDLPLAARTMIINTYCYSKVLFYDRFSPAPVAVIEAIEVAAQAAIWQEKQDARDKRGRLVSTIRLQTPIDHGGFGLFNLTMQLDLARAKWIYKLLSGLNSKNSRPLLDIRSRLVSACLQRDFVRRVGSFPNFTFVKWTWPALLCHPDSLDSFGGEDHQEKFHDVLHVPAIGLNLLSPMVLTEPGTRYREEAQNGERLLFKDGKLFARAQRTARGLPELHIVGVERSSFAAANAAVASEPTIARLWRGAHGDGTSAQSSYGRQVAEGVAVGRDVV